MNDSSLFSSSKSDAKKNGEFFKRASWIGEPSLWGLKGVGANGKFFKRASWIGKPSLQGLKGVGGSFDFLMVIMKDMREDIKIFKDKVLGNAR